MNPASIERLLYVSRAVKTLKSAELDGLVTCSQERNAAEGITGALLFTGQHFSQTIEGPKSSLERIFRSISGDPRHEDLQLLFWSAVPCRRFDHWRMAYLRFDAMDQVVEELWDPSASRRHEAGQLQEQILSRLKPSA